MTSRISSSTERVPLQPSSGSESRRAGFCRRQRELAGHRLWPIALTFLAWFLFHVVGLATALNASLGIAAQNHLTQAQKLYELQNTAASMLGTHSVTWILLTLPLAATLAIEGFAWMDNRQTVDFYESLPVPRNRRFLDICIAGFLYFAFSYIITLGIGLAIAGGMGALSHSLLSQVLRQAVISLAFFLAVYALASLSAMLTGNVIIAWLAFAVLLIYEILFKAVLGGYCAEFFTTWGSRPTGFLDRNILSPVYHYVNGMQQGLFGRTVLWLLALAALYFLLAWICFRLRRNEAAGTAVVFGPVRSLVRLAMAVLAGLMAGLLFTSIGMIRATAIAMLWMVMFAVITACVMQIIYEYDFRALFHRPLEIAAAVVICVLFYLGFLFDITGYDRFLPDPGRVSDAALIYRDYDSRVCSEEGELLSAEDFGERYMHLTDVDSLLPLIRYGQEYTRAVGKQQGREDLVRIDPDIAAAADSPAEITRNGEEYHFFILYRLKNGQTISRKFILPSVVNPGIMDDFTCLPAFREGTFAVYHDDAIQAHADNFILEVTNGSDWSSADLTAARYKSFREAYLQDLSQFSYSFARNNRPFLRVEINYHAARTPDPDTPPDLENLYIRYPVYPTFRNTIEVLRSCNVWLEPYNYDRLPAGQDYDRLSREDRELLDSIDLSTFCGPFHNLVE